MNRRTFLKTGAATAVLTGVGIKTANARIPRHNRHDYDFAGGPFVIWKGRTLNFTAKSAEAAKKS